MHVPLMVWGVFIFKLLLHAQWGISSLAKMAGVSPWQCCGFSCITALSSVWPPGFSQENIGERKLSQVWHYEVNLHWVWYLVDSLLTLVGGHYRIRVHTVCCLLPTSTSNPYSRGTSKQMVPSSSTKSTRPVWPNFPTNPHSWQQITDQRTKMTET